MLFSHRYICIVKPLKTSSLSTMETAKHQMAAVIAISLVQEIPRYLEFQIMELPCEGESFLFAVRTPLTHNHLYYSMYRSTLVPLIRKIVPLTVTSGLTICMIRHLRKQNVIRKLLLLDNASVVREFQPLTNGGLMRVLGMIAIVYMVCILPGAMYPVFRHLVPTGSCTGFFNIFVMSANTLSILNSALNFFIYYPNIPVFRECLKEMFSKCKCRRNRNKVYSSKTSVNVVVTVVSRVEITPCE